MNKKIMKTLALILLFLLISGWSSYLKRTGFLGTGFKEINSIIQKQKNLSVSKGLLIIDVVKGSSAEKAGLKINDVIVGINKISIIRKKKFLEILSKLKAGDVMSLSLQRGKKLIKNKKMILLERPMETNKNFDIIYSSFKSNGYRYRTIITKPKNIGKYPAVFLIQGYDCYSIDFVFRKKHPYKELINDITQKGYVTMRLEKSGIGDSEGPNAGTIGFKKEIEYFKAGLRDLLTKNYVDKNRVFVFGHSMGGVIAPIISKNIAIKGICVMGTTSKSWAEYNIVNTRRQLELRDVDSIAIENYMRYYLKFYSDFLIRKRNPEDIFKEESGYKGLFKEDKYMGRDYTFWQELADINVIENWKDVNCHVLSIWGESDYVSDPKDHKVIAKVVNSSNKGYGNYLSLSRTDHSFRIANSLKDSLNNKIESFYNKNLSKEVIKWLDLTGKKS